MSESKKSTREKFEELNLDSWKDTYGGTWRKPKFSPLEADEQRPMHPYEKCEIELMGFELCMRHNMDVSAPNTVCKREKEDMFECMTNIKKKMLTKKLIAASKEAGDRIPFTQFHWRY